MVNIAKDLKGNVLNVKISGSIEESVNFDQLIGPAPAGGEMIVNSKEVPRINSVGVKAWIKYFQSVQAANCKLRFVECSTSIVEQINLIMNFTCGGTVESLYVPFSCSKCKNELLGLFPTADLKKLGSNLPTHKCTKCGGEAEFDDIPEEYFAFLAR